VSVGRHVNKTLALCVVSYFQLTPAVTVSKTFPFQTRSTQIDRSCVDSHQSNTKRKLEKVLQGQKVQAKGFEIQKDESHQTPTHQSRSRTQNRQTNEKGTRVPNEKIRRQSIKMKFYLLLKKNI
jgi:hypothetical protein